jgi:hypothetical protein
MSAMTDYLSEFLTSVGVTDMQPDADGMYSLVIDGGLPVFIQPVAGGDSDEAAAGVILFAGIGALDPDTADAASRALLEANHFWGDTGGFTLGLIPGTNNVLMCGRERDSQLGDGGLFRLFDRFVSAALHWRRRLPNIAEDAPGRAVAQMTDTAEKDDAASVEPPPRFGDLV